MSSSLPAPSTPIIYPESDGKPMSDNDWQARWMVLLYGNFKALFAARPDVYVGMNMMWYPVEGEPTIQGAPDVFVVLGRPKGDRRSWKQWEENFTPLTVVFEILSPSNTDAEMREKFHFYEEHGVQEYYIYDPFGNTLEVYLRGQQTLVRQRNVDGFRSPRLGIRFVLTEPEMTVYYPTGEPFIPFEQLEQLRRQAEQQALEEKRRAHDAQQRAAEEQHRAEEAEQRVAEEQHRAEEAEQRVAEEQRRAEEAEQRVAEEQRRVEEQQWRLTRVLELGRKARRGQASAAELEELDRLELDSGPATS